MHILREARKNRGLTLTQVKKDLGIDTGNMSRIERGQQIPSVTTAKQLAKYYDLTLDQVFGGEEVDVG